MLTVSKILAKKGKEKIVMLTCYDALSARILEEAGVDIILVGDSLGTVIMGYNSTIPVTIEDVIHHTKAVRIGAPDSFVVTDMPFLSYGASIEDSVKNAGRMLKETGANAVKLEGGSLIAPFIQAMTAIGIPVMGHIGLKPQSVNLTGYRVAGKTDQETESLLLDARAVQEAGAFAIVLEGTTTEAAKAITEFISIPTIGIGAGKETDGQVLVLPDLLGIDPDAKFKHNRAYANLYRVMKRAVKNYSKDVRDNVFPSENETFHQKKA